MSRKSNQQNNRLHHLLHFKPRRQKLKRQHSSLLHLPFQKKPNVAKDSKIEPTKQQTAPSLPLQTNTTEIKKATQQSAPPSYVPNPEEEEEGDAKKKTPDIDLGDKTSGEIPAAQSLLKIQHEREETSSVGPLVHSPSPSPFVTKRKGTLLQPSNKGY